MKRNTEIQFAKYMQRTLAILAIAFLTYSCNDDDLEFDCPEWELNYGDPCQSGTNADTTFVSGFLDTDCNCIPDGIGGNDTIGNNDNDTIGDNNNNSNWDCPDLQVNIGDSCWNSSNTIGYIDNNCECITNTPDFDCPDLFANVGDSCWSALNTMGYVDSNCDCIGDTTEFDCPDLFANVGDSCWGNFNTPGYVNADCDCVTNTPVFDCPDLFANIGDSCVVNALGQIYGTISSSCECEE